MVRLPKPPSYTDEQIDVPHDAARLPSIYMAIGQRGCSKTTTVCRLIKQYIDHGSLNALYGIIPTYFSNQEVFMWAGFEPDNVFTRADQGEAALDEILTRVKGLHRTYKRYIEVKTAIEKHKRGEDLTPHEESLVEGCNGITPVEVKKPRPAILCDDLMFSKFLACKKLTNFALRHRHVCHDPRVGVSLFICAQALKGSVPRALRANVQVYALWGSRDNTQLRDLYDEISGRLTFDQFKELFDHCTSTKYDYLVIDQTQKDPNKIFRQGFDGPWLKVTND